MAGYHALGRMEYWNDGIMGIVFFKKVIQCGF
jgi:hypothetical protein